MKIATRTMCGILIGFIIGICYLCVTSASMSQLKILAVGGWLAVVGSLYNTQLVYEEDNEDDLQE